MRVFLAVLVLIFSLQSWTKADDIRDFQIEGISIGDSLLDYASEKEIKEQMVTDYNSTTYSRYTLRRIYSKNFELYDDIQIHFKTKDKNYIIEGASGAIYNSNEFEECLALKEEVIADTKKILPNVYNYAIKAEPWLSIDSSGKTIVSSYYFVFDRSSIYSDYIELACYDWNEDLDSSLRGTDHLKVGVNTKEFDQWLRTEAYK